MQGLGAFSVSAHAITGLPCSTRSAWISNSNNSNSCSTCTYKYTNSRFLTQVRHSKKAFISLPGRRRRVWATARASSEAMEKLGVKIQRNPPESKLSELGIKQWPKWGCPPSKFPWTYSSTETCYLLKGKVKVTPDGANEAIEIGAGDLVVFPKGMSCTWDVSETVDKHYKFD